MTHQMTDSRKQFLTRLELTCPADAIDAMIRGLRTAKERKDFQVNMGSYGARDASNVCFGCAATCAIMEAAHVWFTPDNIHPRESRASTIGVPRVELQIFEQAMNDFRRGYVSELFAFFDQKCVLPQRLWYMTNRNWEDELPKVEDYLEALRAHDTTRVSS